VILRSQAFSVVLIQYDNAVGLLKRYLKIARIAGLTPMLRTLESGWKLSASGTGKSGP
jgi:hypothetical protein